MPLITFSIELLPAPLGPMMARISCSRTSKVTSCSAFTPPKASEMPSRPRTTPPIFLPPFKPPPPNRYPECTPRAVGVRRQSRPAASPRCGAPARCSCRSPSRRLLRRGGGVGLRFLDAQIGADFAAAPVLELHLRLDELRLLARIERVDQHAVFLRDETAAYLARARQLVVVGIEFLVQNEEAMHLGIAQRRIERELGVGFLHALAHQRVHLVLLRQVGVAGVGNIAPLGPVADRADIDIDEGAHHLAPVTESDRLPDMRKELEL